jgi:apolipoprotein N-acyltransferase
MKKVPPRSGRESFRDARAWGAAALSGLLLFLSFPKFGIHLTAWIALVPLFYALGRAAGIREALKLTFAAGMIFNVGIMYWVGIVVVKYGYLPVYMGVLAVAAMAAALAGYLALFGAGVFLLGRAGVPGYVAAPPLWVVVEFAKSNLFTGFPWENLGYSQTGNLALMQTADIFGVYGISFLIVLVNALLYRAFEHAPAWKKAAVPAALAALLLFSAVSYGQWRMHGINAAVESLPRIRTAIVQGNIDQSIKWNEKFERESLNTFLRLSAGGAGPEPGLVIWPETTTPFFFQDIDDKHRDIVSVARSRNDFLILGSPSYETTAGRTSYMNSAFAVSNTGAVLGRYDKMHLVPFGEYMPFRSIFPFLGQLLPGMSDFSIGAGFHPLQVGDKKVGVLICYESIFPEISREYKKAGAELLVNITNDAWFGRSSAPYQHLGMAAFRAVENRMYVARSANTGISAVIDPCGRVIAGTNLFETVKLEGSVGFVNIGTFYSEYGNWPVPLSFAMLAAAIAAVRLRKKDQERENAD